MKFDVRVRGLSGTFAEARVARLAEAARQLANAPNPLPPVPPLAATRQPLTPSVAR